VLTELGFINIIVKIKRGKVKNIIFGLLISVSIISCNKKTVEISDIDENIIVSTTKIHNSIIEHISVEENMLVTKMEDLHNNMELNNEYMFSNSICSLELNVKTNFAHSWGSNIKPNVNIMHRPESDGIENIQEIDNLLINSVFENPIFDRNIKILSHVRTIYYFTIHDLLQPFEIFLTEEQNEKLVELPLYGSSMNKISFNNLNLYFYKTSGSNNLFLLFMLEYEENSSFYNYNIKIGMNKEEIIEKFGTPTYYSEVGDVNIYYSFSTGRQLNITYDNDVVVKVQMITYEGI
jgi:hypothetical protein